MEVNERLHDRGFPPEDLELLTVDEIAAKLKVKRSWIYTKSRERGPDRIPVIEVGRHYRFFFPVVLQWLEARRRRERG